MRLEGIDEIHAGETIQAEHAQLLARVGMVAPGRQQMQGVAALPPAMQGVDGMQKWKIEPQPAHILDSMLPKRDYRVDPKLIHAHTGQCVPVAASFPLQEPVLLRIQGNRAGTAQRSKHLRLPQLAVQYGAVKIQADLHKDAFIRYSLYCRVTTHSAKRGLRNSIGDRPDKHARWAAKKSVPLSALIAVPAPSRGLMSIR